MSAGLIKVETASQSGHVTTVSAGRLRVQTKATDDRIHLQSLFDELEQRESLAERSGPLWKIAMENPQTDLTDSERLIL